MTVLAQIAGSAYTGEVERDPVDGLVACQQMFEAALADDLLGQAGQAPADAAVEMGVGRVVPACHFIEIHAVIRRDFPDDALGLEGSQDPVDRDLVDLAVTADPLQDVPYPQRGLSMNEYPQDSHALGCLRKARMFEGGMDVAVFHES